MPRTPDIFVNCYGEEWRFHFDPTLGISTVSGSDVGWSSYPVIEGNGYGLALNLEESEWLRAVWEDIASKHPCSQLYAGIETQFAAEDTSCRLSNNYCPLCLRQRTEFDVHHCIWVTDGGPDSASNLLAVCRSCHAVINCGSTEDRFPKDRAAFNHQLMYFGLQLLDDALAIPSRRIKRTFSEAFPELAEAVAQASHCSREERLRIDMALKARAKIEYQYMRDLGLGKWSWNDFEERQRAASGFLKRPGA